MPSDDAEVILESSLGFDCKKLIFSTSLVCRLRDHLKWIKRKLALKQKRDKDQYPGLTWLPVV